MAMIKNWGANHYGRKTAQKLFNDREGKILPAKCEKCKEVLRSANLYGFSRYKCGKEGKCETDNIQHSNGAGFT